MRKITEEQIEGLMSRVSVHVATVEKPAPYVTASAWLDDKYLLATEFSKPVDPANFDEEIGRTIARDRVMVEARNLLWRLEGYRLHHEVFAKA